MPEAPSPPTAMVPDSDVRAATWNIISGLIAFPALVAMADLQIADHLHTGPLTVEDLTGRTGADAASLARLLRTLASIGMLDCPAPGTYALTAAGGVLRESHPKSMRAAVQSIGGHASWSAMSALPQAIRTGQSGFSLAAGAEAYDFYAQNQAGEAFHRFMAARSADIGEALAKTYDFSGVRTLIDVGGGVGTISARVLGEHPALHATVYDLPAVKDNAQAYLNARGLAGRATFRAGDFTSSIPGGDVHIVANVLHNQGDQQAALLLHNLAAAMNPDGRALFIDVLLPDTPEPHFGFLLDLRMRVMFRHGRERTRREYEQLLAEAGLDVVEALALTGPISLIIARRHAPHH